MAASLSSPCNKHSENLMFTYYFPLYLIPASQGSCRAVTAGFVPIILIFLGLPSLVCTALGSCFSLVFPGEGMFGY